MNNASGNKFQTPWAASVENIVQSLKVDPDRGLSSNEASSRLRHYGRNRLRQQQARSSLAILFDQFKNVIILLLALAAVVSAVFDQWLEAVAIVVAIVLNVSFGFFTELRAVRSMEALQQISRTVAAVRRNGKVSRIAAQNLVPGDIVQLQGGDVIPTDMRVLEAARLEVDESPLTGESLPATKQTGAVGDDAELARRSSMLYKGTAVVGGTGHGIVTATGMDTEIGKIASLTEAAESEETPLEKRLNRLGYRLIVLTLAVAGIVMIAGLVGGKPLLLLFETAIALAVAAAPEGLPIVATIALARGMWRLLHNNAMMNRLSAVETLGSTSVICTDKTGTLTENRMAVVCLGYLSDSGDGVSTVNVGRDAGNQDELGSLVRRIIEAGVLCNNAELHAQGDDSADQSKQTVEGVGDPMEVALLRIGADHSLQRSRLLESWPEVREEAFDPRTKMMATFHDNAGERKKSSYRVTVKGAPEAVLEACSHVATENQTHELDETAKEAFRDQNHRMAQQGLRLLAAAERNTDDPDADPYKDLTFLGLIGMQDPPRKDIADAVHACHQAGITVVMVTGDQAPTAAKIAHLVGLIENESADVLRGSDLRDGGHRSEEQRGRLLNAKVFARVSPEQKLDLIALHQQNRSVVAMTGDGVNDAPALKKADIGIAMGKRGTQVAREAADMVLKDDAFRTIVTAIGQGRAIFNNIRKFILFLLSGNVGEIMIVGAAIVAGAPLPLLPLQILYLNMIGDVFPALALAVGRGDPRIMRQAPRPSDEPIITRGYWIGIGAYGVLIAASVLAAFAWVLNDPGIERESAVTVSFLTLSFARIWHVFNMRRVFSPVLINEITRNPYIWGAVAICTGLLLSAVYVPGLSAVLKLAPPNAHQWALIVAFSLLPLLVGQAAVLAGAKIMGDQTKSAS